MPVLLTSWPTALVGLWTMFSGPDAAPPAGALPISEPVTTGQTELEGAGSFATAELPEPTADDDATEFDVSAGGMLSTGNARAASVTGLSRFRLRRGRHQFRADVAGNYGRAAPEGQQRTETNVTNVQGLVRYDVFLHRRVSLFAQVVPRYDPFQGLDLRLNVDPGFAFYVLTAPRHRLWFEVGYDFQFDLRTEEGRIPLDADGNPDFMAPLRDETFINHATRLFGGYTNNLSDHVTFDTGVEYLQSVLDAGIFRVNWGSALTVKVAGRLTASTTFTLRYENRPLVEHKLDTITAVLLGVTIL